MQPKHELLYRMVTGDKNAPRFPQIAVRWHTLPTDIAALVTESSTTRFKAELFHFGHEARAMTADLKLLKDGRYRVQLRGDDKTLAELPEMEIKQDGDGLVKLELPPQKLVVLKIEPAEN